MSDSEDPTRRTTLGKSLAIGAGVVVLVELAVLVYVALGPGEGFERAAIWAVLLMINVTFLTVAGFAYGFYREWSSAAARPERGDDGPPGSDGGSGGVPRGPSDRPGGPDGGEDGGPARGAPEPGELEAEPDDETADRRTPEGVGAV